MFSTLGGISLRCTYIMVQAFIMADVLRCTLIDVLIMVFSKLSASVDLLIGDSLDPLDFTRLTGPIHVQVYHFLSNNIQFKMDVSAKLPKSHLGVPLLICRNKFVSI